MCYPVSKQDRSQKDLSTLHSLLSMDESSIILACQKGQTDQFDALYQAYIDPIYRFVYYKTMHKETAEDLTSEIFIKALQSISTFDTQKGTFSAWLYRIARNRVIDHYRTKKEDRNIEDIWDLSDRTDIERDAETMRQLEKVEGHLKTLKPQQREVIIMRLWDGLSHKEIADVLGISEANSKMIFSRTLRSLRDQLGVSSITIIFLLTNALWPN